MVNKVRFVISELEDLASGSETRLDHLGSYRIFILVKKDRSSFWHRHQKKAKSAPLLVLAREPYTFSIGYYSKSKEGYKCYKGLTRPTSTIYILR